jgi:hypothetical protein
VVVVVVMVVVMVVVVVIVHLPLAVSHCRHPLRRRWSSSLDPAPLSLSSAVIPFCRSPDPLSTPRTGARSGGVWVGVLSRGK